MNWKYLLINFGIYEELIKCGQLEQLDLLITIQQFLHTIFIHPLFSEESIGVVGLSAESGDWIPVLTTNWNFMIVVTDEKLSLGKDMALLISEILFKEGNWRLEKYACCSTCTRARSWPWPRRDLRSFCSRNKARAVTTRTSSHYRQKQCLIHCFFSNCQPVPFSSTSFMKQI